MYIGIDPGKTGALTVSTKEQTYTINMPATRSETVDLFEGLYNTALCIDEKIFAVCEKVSSMPNNSARSMFTFGQMYERVLCCLTSSCIPFELVLPNTWQKEFSIPKRKTMVVIKNGVETKQKEPVSIHKQKILEKAQSLYPKLNIGRKDNADSVLIHEYAKRKYPGY
jgi:hypothetical protein